MNKKTYMAAIIIVLILIIGIVVGLNIANQPNPIPQLSPTPTASPTPSSTILEPSIKPFPLISISVYPNYYKMENISQGATFQENITITSQVETQVPLNLTLTGYNNTSWISSTPQEELFNYTFTPNELNLNENGSSSSILTIQLAEDVPLGRYVFYIGVGKEQITHVGGNTINVEVIAPT